MKAAVKTAKGDFEVKAVETPPIPQPDWVRARVRVATGFTRLAGNVDTGSQIAYQVTTRG